MNLNFSEATWWVDIANNFSQVMILLTIGGIGLLSKWLKEWINHKKMKNCVECSITPNVKVRDLLAEARVLLDADRVELYQFHNGERYLSGEGIKKCSLTHYVLKTAVTAPEPFQGVLTTNMIWILKQLKDAPGKKLTPKEMGDDFFVDSLFAKTGSQLALARTVRDPKKNWTGIMVVSWLEAPEKYSEATISSYADQVGAYLPNTYY